MDKTVLILGGYGRAGYEIANLLLDNTTVKLSLGGRDLRKAEAAVAQLHQRHSVARVNARQVNINYPPEVTAALSASDLVIVTVPYKRNAAQTVISAAVEAEVDYIDINTATCKQEIFAAQIEEIRRSQQIFLTEAGIIPGCPAVMVRWGASKFNQFKNVALGSLMRDPAMPSGSLYDMVAHADKAAMLYEKGQWHSALPFAFKRMDFGQPYGSQLCVPVFLPELRVLPQMVAVEALGVYQAGINPLADLIFLLWKTLGLSRFERSIAWGTRLFQFANRQFTKPPYGITITLQSDERRLLTLHHSDVYCGTAIPVVAAVRQILAGKIERPCQGFMGQQVIPEEFMEDVQQMGLTVRKH